jgi:adenylate cyclase
MTENSLDRKLRAIFSADVKGYSRLMGEDEEHTIKTITAYRETIFDIISNHKGRVVDSPGDNILAEFASALNAVNSAIAIQETLKEKNADLPDNRKMEFRIGINIGDIIHEGDRIYGDGVNVAARIESLADPGGVCISRNVCDQVKKKLTNLGYEYIGAQDVKNISEPVRVYKVLTEPEYAGKVIGEEIPRPAWPWKATTALVILGIVGCVLAVWNFYIRRPLIETASVEKMAFPLPDKPSIAVLPFVNMSDDPKQEYFSDGITDDLITDLSKISGLFVIARNSTFTYKGKPVKVQRVAEDLGVRYVLEGSVRKADKKVRINAQLIDATTGQHLWAERYDGSLGDIFALQDRFTKKIVSALAVQLTGNDQSLLASRDTASVEAYDAYLRGWEFMRRDTRDDLVKAVSCFKEAVELDPDFSRGHTALSLAYNLTMTRGWDVDLGWFDASSLAQKHLKIAAKNPTPLVHREASGKYLYRRQYMEAITEAERALALNPNDPESQWTMGRALVFAGRSAEALEYIKWAIRLNPNYPDRYLSYLGIVQYMRGQYQEAMISLERGQKLDPDTVSGAGPIWLGATYAQLGNDEKAAKVLGDYLKRKHWYGGIPIEYVFSYWPFKELKDLDHFADGLIKAGLPVPWNPVFRRKYKEALVKAGTLLAADPNNPENQYLMGQVLIFIGRPVEAIDHIKKAMNLKPKYQAYYLMTLGNAQFCAEQFEEATKTLETYHRRNPYGQRRWVLAAAYAYLGRQKEAADSLKKAMQGKEYIDYNVEKVVRYMNFPFKNQRDTKRFAEGLRKAGLPAK